MVSLEITFKKSNLRVWSTFRGRKLLDLRGGDQGGKSLLPIRGGIKVGREKGDWGVSP